MNQLLKPGRIIFAIGIFALAILSILSKDFIVGRPPAWGNAFTFNPALAYITACVLAFAAVGVLVNKQATRAALLIALLIFVLSVLRHLAAFMNDWINSFKSLALVGGALIVAASYKTSQKWFVTSGCILLAAFFVASGYAHFKYADFVNAFIPGYIPFHPVWTYFCGICLVAGGVGLLLPRTRKWAALFSGIMVAGWFVLLHVPRFMANPNDPSDRMGLFESFTFVGIFFVLAGMFSGRKNRV